MHDTIKQMAQMFGVTEHTLRFYTGKGLLPCARDGGNRRVFDEESVNWMQGIQCLKGCGASIEDIQTYRRLCLPEESEKNLRARYAIILKQRTMRPFSPVCPRTTRTLETGRRRAAPGTDGRFSVFYFVFPPKTG